MLVVMRPGAVEEDLGRVTAMIESLGFKALRIDGASRTAVAVIGNKGPIDPGRFENLGGVSEAIRVTKPYKLISRDARPEPSVIKIGTASIGGPESAMIAGPCAVESESQLVKAAEAVVKSGAKFFRGGAFKPRTSPYAFQGMGEEGLRLLANIRSDFGLNIITEAMDEKGLDMVARYGDCVQIGARNMQNFSLLKHAGRSKVPVLLKRGLSASLDEFLLAAEYIMAEGNYDVVLCERGIRTFTDHTRNTLDLSIIPALKRVSHLPIIVDPSHGTGHSYMVAPMALAGIAAGADGLIIEVHPEPEKALCDGAQALLPEHYLDLAMQVQALRSALGEAAAARI